MHTQVTGLNRKADRTRFLADLKRAVGTLNVAVETREIDKRTVHVTLQGLGLAAYLSVSPQRGDETPLIHWFNAERPLAYLAGSWGGEINRFHGRKATSFPLTLDHLLRQLLTGFAAALSGQAFREEDTAA